MTPRSEAAAAPALEGREHDGLLRRDVDVMHTGLDCRLDQCRTGVGEGSGAVDYDIHLAQHGVQQIGVGQGNDAKVGRCSLRMRGAKLCAIPPGQNEPVAALLQRGHDKARRVPGCTVDQDAGSGGLI